MLCGTGCSLFRHTAIFLPSALRVLLVHVRTSTFPAWLPRTGKPPASPPTAAGPRLPRVGRASLPGVWMWRTRPGDCPAGAGPAQASLTFSAARSVVSLTFSAVRAAASLLLSTPRTAASLAFSAPRFTAPAVSLMPFLILSVVFPIIVLLCYVDAIRVAHGPAPGCGLCRTSQRVQGGGHMGKGDGAVLSVLYTHVAAKTMPRVSPRRNTPGKVSPCGWDRPSLCEPWSLCGPTRRPALRMRDPQTPTR